jgi:MbtH protein
MSEQQSGVRYKVVVNDEEQHSTWPANRPVPAGWHETGQMGTEQECLEHIEKVWRDVLPRSGRAA